MVPKFYGRPIETGHNKYGRKRPIIRSKKNPSNYIVIDLEDYDSDKVLSWLYDCENSDNTYRQGREARHIISSYLWDDIQKRYRLPK